MRNSATFKDWVLRAAMECVRPKVAGADDGNRQMVDILLIDGVDWRAPEQRWRPAVAA